MSLPAYAVNFRGKPACPCLAEWLPVYEAELQRRGILEGELHIYQLIGGYVGSGGTHASGGAFDLLDLPGEEDLEVGRQMGADAYWTRKENWDGRGGIRHNHGVLTGCPHNAPAAYQIDAVRAGYNGLGYGGRSARDDGPRPLSGRTYKQGIAWAREQQEDDMADPKTQAQLTAIQQGVEQLVKMSRVRDQRLRAILKAQFKATDKDLDAIFAKVNED